MSNVVKLRKGTLAIAQQRLGDKPCASVVLSNGSRMVNCWGLGVEDLRLFGNLALKVAMELERTIEEEAT